MNEQTFAELHLGTLKLMVFVYQFPVHNCSFAFPTSAPNQTKSNQNQNQTEQNMYAFRFLSSFYWFNRKKKKQLRSSCGDSCMAEDKKKHKLEEAPSRPRCSAKTYTCTRSQWSIPRAHFKINGDLLVVHDSYSFQGRATVLIFFLSMCLPV